MHVSRETRVHAPDEKGSRRTLDRLTCLDPHIKRRRGPEAIALHRYGASQRDIGATRVPGGG